MNEAAEADRVLVIDTSVDDATDTLFTGQSAIVAGALVLLLALAVLVLRLGLRPLAEMAAGAEAAVRSLAADTSHELRTPLSSISSWLDLHRQGGLTGAGLDDALGRIEHEVGRTRLLVEDLSLLARLDAGRPLEQAPVDVTVLTAGVVEDAHITVPSAPSP